jgi:hypothetical protein
LGGHFTRFHGVPEDDGCEQVHAGNVNGAVAMGMIIQAAIDHQPSAEVNVTTPLIGIDN